MKSSRNAFTMIMALALAAAAAVGVYLYANPAEETTTTQGAPVVEPTPTSVPTTVVLIAKQDIAAHTSVTAEMVEIKQVLPADKNARALSTPEEAIGKVTTVALARGEQILNSRMMADPAAAAAYETFAYNVPAGKRAFSLVFDEVIGAGALVQPGDHVDVIAYFEIDVTDPVFRAAQQAAAIGDGAAGANDDADEDSANDDDDDNADKVDYTQYVSAYIVQDVEVLAVAQALTPDESGVSGPGAAPTPTPEVTVTAAADENDATSTETPVEAPGDPVARPTAVSVTLAVTPEQAQRLMLAALTVKKEKGGLRLSLRAPGDTTTVVLRPAQLGEIPLGGLLGDVNQPMIPSELVITDAEFTRRVLSTGEVLEFTVTVKNISSETTIQSGEDAPPDFTYTQGTAYDALGFYAEPGTYRLGLNVSGAYPTQYPYRWSLGRDLKPGESIEVVGSVEMTDTTPATSYWFGVILEPDIVAQDGVGATDITVLEPAAAVVRDATAQLRTEPSADGEIVTELRRDDYLTVLETRGDWFRVQTGDTTEGWIEIAAVDVVPPLAIEVATPENAASTPVSATPASGTPVSTTPAST